MEESAATGVWRAKQRESRTEDGCRPALTSPRGFSAHLPGRVGAGSWGLAFSRIPGRGLGLAAWTQSGAAKETRNFFFIYFLVREERGLTVPLKRAPETGESHGYQVGPQRRAWDAKAAAAATKKPVCKQRSLSTPPLPGACAARHCQGPMIQGQLLQEKAQHASGWCNVMLASAAAVSPRIHIPPFPPAGVSQKPQISYSFNLILSERRADTIRQPTRRGRPTSKAEPWELCEQRREREISPSSLRSSGLNPHSQLDAPCNCGIPE